MQTDTQKNNKTEREERSRRDIATQRNIQGEKERGEGESRE